MSLEIQRTRAPTRATLRQCFDLHVAPLAVDVGQHAVVLRLLDLRTRTPWRPWRFEPAASTWFGAAADDPWNLV